MKLPEDLKGEVKKLEDLLRENIALSPLGDTVWSTVEILDFYTQPFKPDKKYFDYCGTTSIIRNEQHKYYQFSANLKHGWSIQMAVESIKTLSDFINACLNSDIKINWKAN